MAQLYFYVPDGTADAIRRKAAARNLPVSKYLAQIVKREVIDDWPAGFFDKIIGGWSGEPLSRPPQGEPEKRDAF
jgi:hypothetical protein